MGLDYLIRKKHCKGEGIDESTARICDMPDPILELIVSSLPTKQAIQTSVLSSRWKHVWRGISKIDLVEMKIEKRQQFTNFVSGLLAVCDCWRPTKFSLKCRVGEYAWQVNEWLQAFIHPKIQELIIYFIIDGNKEPLVFPDHLFTCSTLVKLVLSMELIFKIPSSVHFERLRMLMLMGIIFPDNSSTQQLFSGCPSLEELILVDCNWVNVKVVCISSPLLQKISITEYFGNDEDIYHQNVSKCCKVVIVGTNLKSFEYVGIRTNDYFLYGSTTVTNASVQVQVHPESYLGPDWEIDAGYFVFKLLRALSNVEELSISEASLMVISKTSFLGHLPLFCNLVELSVVVHISIKMSHEALQVIFQNSPGLQVVNFERGVSLSQDCADRILDPLPMCFSTNLRRINIYDFLGDEEELHAIKILLQAASVMDTLYICYFPRYAIDYLPLLSRMKELYKQIVNFPKGSTDCKIDLECR